MKSNVIKSLCLSLPFGLALATTCAAQASSTNASSLNVTIPKSVFADDAKVGKDPFYPHSVRRGPQQPKPAEVVNNVVVAPANPLAQLQLKGISGTRARPLALINNVTVAAGEVAEIRVENRVLKVRCLEVRERSCVVEPAAGGERRELKLREGI